MIAKGDIDEVFLGSAIYFEHFIPDDTFFEQGREYLEELIFFIGGEVIEEDIFGGAEVHKRLDFFEDIGAEGNIVFTGYTHRTFADKPFVAGTGAKRRGTNC